MKTRTLVGLLALSNILGVGLGAAPLGTAFTYQGKLADGGQAANGIYDLRFTIYGVAGGGTALAGPITNSAVAVVNGLFTTTLDFGSEVFAGEARWLEIAARTNGAGAFTILSARQPVTPTPAALYASQAGVVANVATGSITSVQIADGTITFADLAQNGATDGQVMKWSSAQNRWMAGPVTGSTGLLGYAESGPFNVAPVATGNNAIAQGEHAQALGSGSVVGGGLDNLAGHWFATVGGGWSNSAGGLLFGRTTVAGGEQNTATGDWSTVGGGQLNTAGGPLYGRATVAGGWENVASGDMAVIGGGSQNRAVMGHAVIGGGQFNTVSNGAWSAIGGGYSNRVLGVAATIPGGAYNEATEAATFAAGRRAKAIHPGAFVWADNSANADFTSSAGCQFAVRATGGAHFLAPDLRLWHPLGGDYGWGAALRFGDADNAFLREEADDYLRLHARLGIRLTGGNVGIGTAGPAGERLEVDGGNIRVRGPGGFDAVGEEATVLLGDGNHYIKGVYGYGVKIGTWPVGDALCVTEQGGGFVGIGTNTPQTKLHVVGTARTSVLEITGGADLAEPFEISDTAPIPEGAVVVIDQQNPGRLRLSTEAYDKRVAGVVSGAGSLKPGLVLSQAGVTDSGMPVALSGRVFVLADAADGAIQPGDQLTTSATPGHARKVTDYELARGAVLGKAMSSLETGRGLVLVLVTLQ